MRFSWGERLEKHRLFRSGNPESRRGGRRLEPHFKNGHEHRRDVQHRAGRIHDFRRETGDDLIADLQRADLVVGFNVLRFDYEVLHGYTSFDLRQLPTLDMMVELQNTLNHRLSPDSIATATFAVEKNGGRIAGHPLVQGRPARGNCGVLLLRRETDEACPRIRPASPTISLQQSLRQENDRAGELVNRSLTFGVGTIPR